MQGPGGSSVQCAGLWLQCVWWWCIICNMYMAVALCSISYSITGPQCNLKKRKKRTLTYKAHCYLSNRPPLPFFVFCNGLSGSGSWSCAIYIYVAVDLQLFLCVCFFFLTQHQHKPHGHRRQPTKKIRLCCSCSRSHNSGPILLMLASEASCACGLEITP